MLLLLTGAGEDAGRTGAVPPSTLDAGLSGTGASSCGSLDGRFGFVKLTFVLNMLLVAADKPPVFHVLWVNTEAMFAMSCSAHEIRIVGV